MSWSNLQWGTFAKQWWLYNAYMQCPMLSGEKIAKYLKGQHKPIYKSDDVGDTVIVFNTRQIAVKDNSSYWKRFLYTDHTRFGKFVIEQTIEELHRKDPTIIMKKEVRSNIPNNSNRSHTMLNLFLFPDGIDTVPKELIKNVSGVIRQVLPIHKKLSDYSQEEIDNYPKILKLPTEYSLTNINTVFNKIN